MNSTNSLDAFLTHLVNGGHLPQFLAVLDRRDPPKTAAERFFSEDDYENMTSIELAHSLLDDLGNGTFDYHDYDKRIAQIGGLRRVLPSIQTNASKARWRQKMFGYWQPRQDEIDRWYIVKELMVEGPLIFVDEEDEQAGYQMDEDEALERARFLNSINFTGDDPVYSRWHVRKQYQ